MKNMKYIVVIQTKYTSGFLFFLVPQLHPFIRNQNYWALYVQTSKEKKKLE